jgi:hypothetical protein
LTWFEPPLLDEIIIAQKGKDCKEIKKKDRRGGLSKKQKPPRGGFR